MTIGVVVVCTAGRTGVLPIEVLKGRTLELPRRTQPVVVASVVAIVIEIVLIIVSVSGTAEEADRFAQRFTYTHGPSNFMTAQSFISLAINATDSPKPRLT
jgi:hypothetical protein